MLSTQHINDSILSCKAPSRYIPWIIGVPAWSGYASSIQCQRWTIIHQFTVFIAFLSLHLYNLRVKSMIQRWARRRSRGFINMLSVIFVKWIVIWVHCLSPLFRECVGIFVIRRVGFRPSYSCHGHASLGRIIAVLWSWVWCVCCIWISYTSRGRLSEKGGKARS